MSCGMTTGGFKGARVAAFEGRKARWMEEAISQSGGVPVIIPVMREAAAAQDQALAAFQELSQGQIQVIIFMTETGTRLFLQQILTQHEPDEIVFVLQKSLVVSRGIKPAQALRQQGITVDEIVPEPSTWNEILEVLDESRRGVDIAGKTILLQESGMPHPVLLKALNERGARVKTLSLYQWELPENLEPVHAAIREIIAENIPVCFFTNSTQARHLFKAAEISGQSRDLQRALRKILVASLGPSTSAALREEGIEPDFQASHPKLESLIAETAKDLESLLEQKWQGAEARISAPVEMPAGNRKDITAQSIFLCACRGEKTPYTPVWLMRQAGRYMKEYRALRDKVSFMEMCKNPELAAEVTITALEKIRADAAIIFSDILVVLEPMGLGLEFVKGDGPVIHHQIRSGQDIDLLREIEPEESLGFVFDALRLTRANLRPEIPLIGFCGAPFTLASYIIEGGSSKSFAKTKTFMYTDPGAWHALMEKLSRGLILYLRGQIAAGADALQMFDSWIGCLSPADYREFVLPHSKKILEAVKGQVPLIHFGTGTGPFLRDFAGAGSEVVGFDFRVDLEAAWNEIGTRYRVQGNLDPVVLLGSREFLRQRTTEILRQAGQRPGHIFNLGHGILPNTSVDQVIALIDMVREISGR